MPEIKPGVYLEVKKGVIGTGVTAKSTEYRNFWMTLTVTENEVELLLLDQDFNLTGVTDKLSVDEFLSGRFSYIAQGEKRYQLLLNKLVEKNKAASPGPKPGSPAKPKADEGKAEGKWWEGSSKQLTAEDIFSKKPEGASSGDSESSGGSGNWWEPKKPKPAKDEGEPNRKKKKPSDGVKIKKTWWDK